MSLQSSIFRWHLPRSTNTGNNNSFPLRVNNRVLVLMAPLSWLFYTVCAAHPIPVLPCRHQQRSCSFSLWKRTRWQPGPCEVGGDARIPSKTSGLGETMTQFYQLCLCRWSSERDWLRCARYQRATASIKSFWKMTFTVAPTVWAENGLGDSCGGQLGKHNN